MCPLCEYALAGLPPPHRCPECGFEYDERTRAWYAPVGARHSVDYFGPIVAMGMIVVGLWPVFYGGMVRPIHLAFFAVLMLGLVWIVRGGSRKLASRRSHFCVAITPRGLYILNEVGEEWIAWNEVGRAVFSGEFSYVTCSRGTRTVALPGVFTDHESQAAFSELVQTTKSHYLERSGPNEVNPPDLP